uniref:Uncharacterized protein n=1 Tax=Aegilops tauschii subsp. strangulata TaxID=200361 RepID=A0A453HMD1_AEGTS
MNKQEKIRMLNFPRMKVIQQANKQEETLRGARSSKLLPRGKHKQARMMVHRQEISRRNALERINIIVSVIVLRPSSSSSSNTRDIKLALVLCK